MNAKGTRLFKALSSLKLTIALLFGMVVLCLIGTIFPQEGVNGHAFLAGVPDLLSPYHIFQSVWIMAVGLLLCVNLVLCMRTRIRMKRRNLIMLTLHGGILLIIAGYALGGLSVDGFMEIPEGGSLSMATLKNGLPQDLGYAVRCDRFTVDFYPNGMPREYVSELSFLEHGRVAGQSRVMVNHPARFRGYSLYQESFQTYLAAVVGITDGKKAARFVVEQGSVMPLGADGAQARVVKVWDDLMHAGPALKLLISDSSGERYLWVFRNFDALNDRMPGFLEQMPAFDPSGYHPYTFTLEGLRASYATGIGIKRDPGAWVAGIGGGFFLVSLLLLFMVPRTGMAQRRETVSAAEKGGPSASVPAGEGGI